MAPPPPPPRPRTDSPVSLSIVASFLQFLSSVEAAPGADTEGLEVASQCLSEVFGLNRAHRDTRIQQLPLVDLFTAGLAATAASDAPTASSAGRPAAVASASSSDGMPKREPPTAEPSTSSGDSLLEQFREGLDLAGYFDGTRQGTPEYAAKFDQAKQTLESALKEVRSSKNDANWSATYSDETLALAEAFKSQGNTTMTALRYHDAIQLYTLAISLCSNNPIFYSNRAAALTHVEKYDEAIADCVVAIKLDPRYSKAYSRMGLAYFAQGRLEEAIEKGFKKALEIDPSNVSIRENLKTAQQKLGEQARAQQHEPQSQPAEAQAAGAFHHMASGMGLPPEIASLLPGIMNLAATFGSPMEETPQQASSPQNPADGRNSSATPGTTFADGDGAQRNPEVGLDGNFSVTVNGQQLPPGLMHSVFQQMFGGTPGQNNFPAGSNQNTNPQPGPPRTPGGN